MIFCANVLCEFLAPPSYPLPWLFISICSFCQCPTAKILCDEFLWIVPSHQWSTNSVKTKKKTFSNPTWYIRSTYWGTFKNRHVDNIWAHNRAVGRSQILVGLDYNSPWILVGLHMPFTTVILKYWWGCSPSAPPIPTALLRSPVATNLCEMASLFFVKSISLLSMHFAQC